MNAYTVAYRTFSAGEEKEISFLAKNKADAYEKAFFEEIPKVEGECPYSAWVRSVTYNNGNYHRFNTCEGLAY